MPGAPETTGSHPKALWPGVKAWWGVGYGEHAEEFRQLFEMAVSTQAWEEDVEQTGYGLAPVKREGTSVTYNGRTQGVVSRYTNIAYALGFIVTFEEQLNNLYAKVANGRSKSIGFSMRQTKEINGANVYNNAFDSTYLGGDGVELLSTLHPTASGTQSNELDPSADISEASLEALSIQIMKAKDSKGHFIGLQPQSVIVPPDLYFEACRILKSDLQNDTANNATNALRSINAYPGGIQMNHFLTDTDAFFTRTNAPEGMKLYQRHKFDLKQDNDFDTQNLKAFSYDYYSMGWSDFRGLFGSAGA